MFRRDDLETAITRGVITSAQSDAIMAIARERRTARVFALGREERFRLLGGFNDLFIAIGVVLLGIAMWSLPLLALPVLWALAELLTGRFRLVAPSIVIVVLLATFAGLLGSSALSELVTNAARAVGQPLMSQDVAGVALAVAVMIGLHYARFRFPFSLFVLGGSLVTLVLTVATWLLQPYFSETPAGALWAWMVVGMGLLVFLVAMSYDIADPERTSRRADCGFWLHLLAAPMIVHPVASPLITHPIFGRAGVTIAEPAIGLVVALVGALAVVALIVDRRALLVAGLAYLGAAMSYALTNLAGGQATVLTLAAMGTMIIVLGIGWRPIRGSLMSRLPDGTWKRALPPYESPENA